MELEPIKVDGLVEFSRAVKALDSSLPKALKAGLNNAMNIIVEDAKPRVVRKSGRAASSLKAASTADKARIKAGGTKAPHFPWLDFGGKRKGRGGGVAVRPFLKEGRYVWKSFYDKHADVMHGLELALVTVAREAGLDVTFDGGA